MKENPCLITSIDVPALQVKRQADTQFARKEPEHTIFVNAFKFFSRLKVNDKTHERTDRFKKIKQLPPEAKRQAQDFIDFLYQRYTLKKVPRRQRVANCLKILFSVSGNIEMQ